MNQYNVAAAIEAVKGKKKIGYFFRNGYGADVYEGLNDKGWPNHVVKCYPPGTSPNEMGGMINEFQENIK